MTHNIFKLGTGNRFSRRFLIAVSFVVALLALALPGLNSSSASSPSGGIITPTTTLTWIGTATGGGALNAPLGLINGEDLCQEGLSCDTFTLTVGGTTADWSGKLIHVKIEWLLPVTDYDLYIHKDSNTGPIVGSSGRGATSPTGPLTWEDTTIDPAISGVGVYTIRAVYYAATAADQYHGSAIVEDKPAPQPTPTPSTEAAPRYTNYPAPPELGNSAGEPTIGVNWDSGNAMFMASLQTLRIKWDDTASPAPATWEDVSATNTSLVTSDPILFTDSDAGPLRTNRTFVSQLLGKTSAMSFTDDDGAHWTPSQGSGINSGVDHQTIGGGPYAKNPDGTLKGGAIQHPGPNGQIYPNAIYYASQDAGLAEIARSDDGGFTFGVAIPMWTLVQCNGLHGHIKVAPDGTVYVPNRSCGGKQGVAVSEDNGLSWSIRTVDGSTAGDTDPSVGVGPDGTVYLGWADGDGHARVAVSHDRGLSWEHVQDVGAAQGIQNTVFSAVIAGDSNRAAYFFLGSTTPGANGRHTDLTFPGTWFGYIATTYDGGASWVTVNATPNDPVQRGVVCTDGPTCPDGSRGLLDFNDLTVDKQGRALAAYSDGCVTAECIRGVDRNSDGKLDNSDNDNTAKATIIRQTGGKPLFGTFDPPPNATPAPPLLIASKDGDAVVNLAWSIPDDGGSPITGYRLYRGVEGGAEALLSSFGADSNSYVDNDASAANYYYRVTATNANGEGASSPHVLPRTTESPCTGFGVTVMSDPAGDSLDQLGSHDIRSLYIAEPFSADGSQKLVFTLKMTDLSDPLTSNTTWRVYFTGTDGNGYFVDMRTDVLGAVSFKYGTYIHNTDNTAGTATTVGNLDAGSKYDTQTDAITLVVSNSKIGNPQAGGRLSRMFVRVPVVAVVPDNANYASPSTAVGYTLIGNAACQSRPATPSSLTAVGGQSKGSAVLNWADNSDNETNFLIERSTSLAGGYIQVATLAANVRSYTDNTVFRKTTYFYRVRAANSGGKSSYSNVASVKTK
jgi:Fibronectin type III domain